MSPAEIQAREDAMNRALRNNGAGYQVCLHADATVSERDGAKLCECDYCPARYLTLSGARVPMAAWLWPGE